MGLKKRVYTDQETVITAENLNEIQDAILSLEDGLFSVDNDKSGEVITITDATNRGLRGLKIYGKTTQRKTTGVQMIPMPYKIDKAILGGVTFEQQADGSVKCTGTTTSAVYFTLFGGYAQEAVPIPGWLTEGETYTISGGTEKVAVALFLYKEDGTTWQNAALSQSTFVMPSGYSYIGIFVYCPNGVTASDTVYPMLNAGSTAADYEPYTGGKPSPSPDYPQNLASVGDSGNIVVNVTSENDAQSMTITTPNGLPGIPVDSGGNFTDANGQQWICDEIDLARGMYIKRVAGVVLNGSETWNYQESSKYFYTHILDRKPGTNLLCDRLPHVRFISAEVPGWWADDSTNRLFAAVGFVTSGVATTTAGFKAYIAERPLNLLYVLDVPIETPLSEEELAAYSNLHTYKTHTTVSNDASAHMALDYVMDAKKYIDSLMTGGIIPATVE